MGENRGMGLDQLPNHLLQRILQLGDFGATDLASLEVSCYTFRAPSGMGPIRFKPMTEAAALHSCQSDPLYSRLPSSVQSQLVKRCEGNWKLMLRFLKAANQAASGVATGDGKLQVVAGKYLTFFIDGKGMLFGCGSNQFGVLGQGPMVIECPSPMHIAVPMASPVAQISATHHHAAFITQTGQVFTYGDNSSGCCGHGDLQGPLHRPTLVESLRSIPCKQVATGLSFTVVLTREGEVYAWGSASHGQLGHGDTTEQSQPVRVESLSTVGKVAQISTGASYTLAVMNTGELYSFGYGANYCLGHGDFASELQPRQVSFFQEHKIFIISAVAGDEHSVAIDSEGQVYTWGKGYCGPLGHGDEEDQSIPRKVESLQKIRAVQISARRRKTFVLADSSELFAFGWMAFGSLGLPDRGSSDKVLEPQPLVGHKIAQVSAGFYHTVAITSKGTLFGFGDREKCALNFDEEFLLMAHLLL